MDRGTYAAASGGLLQFRKLEVANNNLANVNTPGFKKQILVGQVQSFDQTLAKMVSGEDPFASGDHARSPGTINERTSTDFTPGPIKYTGNPLDVALRHPNDFFVINTAEGERYTRAGNFSLNEAGEIVTPDGNQVVGDGGAITANGPGLSISPDGSVRVNGNLAGKFKIVRFEDPSNLQRVGSTRFEAGQGNQPAQVDAELEPNALEMSNVSAITSVIDLITSNRAFDMYTRSAKTIDDMNSQAISQVGRRRG